MKRHYLTYSLLILILSAQSGCAMVKDLIAPETQSTPYDDPFVHSAAAPDRFDAEMSRADSGHTEETDAQYIQELQIARARRQREIILGMSPEDVRAVWGQPRDVETAGDLHQGNQRWTYYEGLSSRWSLSTSRVIYFEDGKVAGWETK